MKYLFVLRFSSISLLLCFSALWLSSACAQEVTSDAGSKASHIIVISLDGTRPDALLLADTPNIQELAAKGAASWEASTVFPPVTLPAHTSMLTGLAPEDHGVDFNDMQPDCPPLEFSTFLTLAEEAGYKTALVTGKEKFCMYNQSPGLDYTFAREGDRSVVDRALELLDEGYEVLFLHFPNPDFFGHSLGWMSETYITELSSTDRQIGRLIAKLAELNITEETLIIITSDHGGHGTGHGQNIPEDMLIPWVIAGPGVVAGTALGTTVNVADTAATVLWALDIPALENSAGKPVLAAFGLEAD